MGEKVSCCASPEACVTAIKDDGTITLSLLLFGIDYQWLGKGKEWQFKPELSLYNYQTHFDTTPAYFIDTIKDIFGTMAKSGPTSVILLNNGISIRYEEGNVTILDNKLLRLDKH